METQADKENGLVDTVGEGEGGRNWESIMETYTLPYVNYLAICKLDSWWEFAAWFRELNLVLCDHLEGWDGGETEERLEREGTYVYLWLIHVGVRQKVTQCCKQLSFN